MKYAVNVADMCSPTRARMMGLLLAPVTPNQQTVQTDMARFDEVALVLECDEVRAKAIIAVIRIKYKKSEMRCYECRESVWRRV
jgi:hypothetical protein